MKKIKTETERVPKKVRKFRRSPIKWVSCESLEPWAQRRVCRKVARAVQNPRADEVDDAEVDFLGGVVSYRTIRSRFKLCNDFFIGRKERNGRKEPR